MSFCIFDSDIALCSGENVILFDVEANHETVISLPKLDTSKELTRTHNNEDLECFHTSTNVVFSADGRYLAVGTRKQLCLFRRSDRHLVANRTLVRAASRIRFTPANDVVVADKSGDAYFYSTEHPEQPGTLILGHLSMLLDVLVTRDSRYIVTADRDEKIRVSMFPNSYNIVSYCLGHEKFVTNVAQLWASEILVSAGGDGCFRFWNFETGEEIRRLRFQDRFQEEDVRTFNESLRKFDVEETEASLPVKHLRVLEIDEKSCVVVASFYISKRVLIYKVERSSSGVEVEFGGELEVEDEPLDCFVRQQEFWVLTDERVRCHRWKDGGFVRNEEVDDKLEKLNESWRKLRANLGSGTLFPILYKRRYDNVQEYQERKKLRLNKTGES